MSKAHPGFKAVQAKIARKEGVGKARAGAILAAATRKASPAAKRKNPALKRVKGNPMDESRAHEMRRGDMREDKRERGR